VTVLSLTYELYAVGNKPLKHQPHWIMAASLPGLIHWQGSS